LQILSLKQVVDLDSSWVVSAGRRSPIQSSCRKMPAAPCSAWEQVHHFLCNRIDQFPGWMKLEGVPLSLVFRAGIGSRLSNGIEGAGGSSGRSVGRSLECAGIGIVGCPAIRCRSPTELNVPPFAAHISPKLPVRSGHLGTPADRYTNWKRACRSQSKRRGLVFQIGPAWCRHNYCGCRAIEHRTHC